MTTARALVATRPLVKQIALDILAPRFETVYCATVEAAKLALAGQQFDLVFCTLQFDGSAMFDLLRFMRANPATSKVPFVSAKLSRGILDDKIVSHALHAAELMGASHVVDFPTAAEHHGYEQACVNIRTALEQLTRQSRSS